MRRRERHPARVVEVGAGAGMGTGHGTGLARAVDARGLLSSGTGVGIGWGSTCVTRHDGDVTARAWARAQRRVLAQRGAGCCAAQWRPARYRRNDLEIETTAIALANPHSVLCDREAVIVKLPTMSSCPAMVQRSGYVPLRMGRKIQTRVAPGSRDTSSTRPLREKLRETSSMKPTDRREAQRTRLDLSPTCLN